MGVRTANIAANSFFRKEYHNLISPNLGPTYHDFAIGSSFACTCTVPSLPDHVFGSPTISFASKKAARTKSAREAVEHLISKGLLNEDGSTKSRKKAKLETAVAGLESNNGRLLKVKKTASYAQKCNGKASVTASIGQRHPLDLYADQ